jgi:hypothetical protein
VDRYPARARDVPSCLTSQAGTGVGAPASGRNSTTCSWTSWATTADSTGPAPASPPSACAPSGGLPDRPEPDRPRQARKQVPPAGRPRWHPLGGVAVSRQHPRLDAAGGCGRRRPADQDLAAARVGRASARPSSMVTRGTTTSAVARRCGAAASPRGSPGVASSPASGWAATGTSPSGRWRGWLATGACRSATSDALTSCWDSSPLPAR